MDFEKVTQVLTLAWVLLNVYGYASTKDVTFVVMSSIGLVCMAGMVMFGYFKGGE